jgi:hypothetical protein
MKLFIQKYCTIVPDKVISDGQQLINVNAQETLEKSIIQTYHELKLNYVKFFKMDNLSKLAILAAETLLKGTDLYNSEENIDTAVVFSNASSSLVTDINYQKTIQNPENYFPSPSLFVYTLPNISIGEICIKHKIYGENVFLISRKFNSELLYFNVNELFENTNVKNCITGWLEVNETGYEALLLLVNKVPNLKNFECGIIDDIYNSK